MQANRPKTGSNNDAQSSKRPKSQMKRQTSSGRNTKISHSKEKNKQSARTGNNNEAIAYQQNIKQNEGHRRISSMGRKQSNQIEPSQNSNSQQSNDPKVPPLIQLANKFRIAIPTQIVADVSSKYWDKISNQINQDKQGIKEKLASQRLISASSSQNLFSNYEGIGGRIIGSNIAQGKVTAAVPFQPTLSNVSSVKDMKGYTGFVGGSIQKNEIDIMQRPFQFLANVGGKETSQTQFTTKIDKKLLQSEGRSSSIVGSQGGVQIFQNFNNIKDAPTQQEIQKPDESEESIAIYTNMNVDKHDFDIRMRRNIHRAQSASQRPMSTHRTIKSGKISRALAIQTSIQKPPQILQRPTSGMVPQTMSQKVLNYQPQPNIQQQQHQQITPVPQIRSTDGGQKDFKISKRPFSANPKYMQLSGMNRPFSAQLRFGETSSKKKSNKENIVESDEEDVEEEEDEYVDLNALENNYNKQPADKLSQVYLETESFSQRIMESRPTTAYRKDKNLEMPFPELFDRSERTFAATFAKYGDLSYYTPIQRIGTYMDFQARLKKRHLMDLIAYMKTSKHTVKPADEEENEKELAEKDFLESCLFIGVMLEEENQRDNIPLDSQQKIDQQLLYDDPQNAVYDPLLYKFEGSFQFEKVWSPQLISQVNLSVTRFFKYIESNDAIKQEEITKYKKDWMSHALDLVPDSLLQTYSNEVRQLFSEVFISYSKAMKQAILEYILRSPDERKRLHILMLPRPIPTSNQRISFAGGYSVAKYQGSHQRKIETENEIKLRLLNNNIVISSLLSWNQDFRSIKLVEFRNIRSLINEDIQQSPQALYSMDFDNFIYFQDCFRSKAIQLIQHIWHRGCIMIVKKFKLLRTRKQQQALEHGKVSKGKWTFSGFKPNPDYESERQFVEELKLDEWLRLTPQKLESQLQRYYVNTGIVHNQISLTRFEIESGFNIDDIPEDYLNETEVDELIDVRENSAYIAFVSMIGGYINFEENGYEILAKEYKRELKYAAGNMMKLFLREVIDKSVETLLNFFKGFKSVNKIIKLANDKPMRKIRPIITKTRVKQLSQEEQNKKKQDEDSKTKDSKIQQQLAKRKEQARKQRENEDQENNKDQQETIFDKEPQLIFPDFYDFQDFMQPVFRLELVLGSQVNFAQSLSTLTGETLEFSKKEHEIIDDFEQYFDRLINSLNDINRPEFSKVQVLSKQRYADDLDEETRQKKLNIKVKKQTAYNRNSQTSFQAQSQNMTGMSASNINFFGSKLKDFDSILYKDHEDGQDVYKKYIGRIQIKESLRDTKDIIDDNNMGVFSKPFVEKKMKIADIDEEVYQQIKHKIQKILIKHLKEAKRVCELYIQFEPVIRGTLQLRVNEFVKEDRREREYEQLIKELKYYQKLSIQLPGIVFFPMFEIGTSTVREEIQRRLKRLLDTVFAKCEQQLISRSEDICEKYNVICKYLDKTLKSPQDVLEMDRYKNNLLLEIGNLQERMFENRKSAFFLLHNDKMFNEVSWPLIKELHDWPFKLNQHIEISDDRHRNERNDIENMVIRKRDQFEIIVKELDEKVLEVGTWDVSDMYIPTKYEKITDFQDQIEQYDEQMQELSSQEMMLFGYKSPYENFNKIKKFFAPYNELWTNIHEIIEKKRFWNQSVLHKIDPEEVDTMIKTSIKTLIRLKKHLNDNQMAQKMIQQMSADVNELNEQLRTIEILCNPCLKERHWEDIQRVSQNEFDYKTIQLMSLKYLGFESCLDMIEEISEKAKKENRLEKMLDKMENEWKDLRFELTHFRDTGILILQGQNVEDIQQLLDEHTLTAQTIRSSPDVIPMEQRAINWEKLMSFLQEVIEIWVRVQANYLYLEPIFHSEDIVKKLPQEYQDFTTVDRLWRDLMNKVQQDTLVLHLNKIKNIQENLDEANSALEKIQKSLNDYLETKRQYFPRFYFLSNEDLLEILGDSKKPQKVQRHLKKCFEGINKIIFKGQVLNPSGDQLANEPDEEIVTMVSRESEQVNFVKPIFPHEYKGNVEQWLLELETQMKLSVQHVIAESHADYQKNRSGRNKWLAKWQGQVVLVVSQIEWTQQIENALKTTGLQGLKDYQRFCQTQLEEIVNLVRQDLPSLLRLTLGSLIVIDVHAKDVLDTLIDEKIDQIDDFQWLSQLRYYFLQQERHVLAKMITTVQDYGYEYLGNTGRLVITPLTDRCYRTLMSALHLNLGGAPEGPAGTGKTESTKDLAKAISVHCMVFNCAEGLNAKAMAKFFKGLASAGSWSCFDEFNRIDLEVLSVVAQQILEIQRAKNQKKDSFHFEGSEITLKSSCNIFITMNPGYAGRSELPDNLKALFRPVAMMMPDYTMIAEISLYSFGFFESRNLAKKIVATYRLCSEQLSSQYHYDYGMRAVKAVLTAAKGLKQKYPEEREDILMLRSINDVNLPKFLAHDIPLFQGIIEDLFQGISLPDIQYGSLDICIRKIMKEQNLQEIKSFMQLLYIVQPDQYSEKVFQLYEMINCRHGLMLVGPPFGAKTQCYRVLAKALTQVTKDDIKYGELPVDYYVINPKSITLNQLYGSFDPISQDFTDGILGQIFRRCAYKDVGKSRRWIVFDGPVDAEWIENMNTVLDDNKKLCLMNGEVIMMNDQMNLIFEAHDLSQASPATVSRCGMVYMQPENIGWISLLQSWIEKLKMKTKGSNGEQFDPQLVKRLEDLFEIFFVQSLVYIKKKCTTYVPVSDVQLCSMLMKIYQSQLTNPQFLDFCYNPKVKNDDIVNRFDMYFLFSLFWSVGAVCDDAGQKQFSHFLRKMSLDVYKVKGNKQLKLDKNSQIPDGGSIVQNYYIQDQRWINWKEVLDKSDQNKDFDPSLTYHELIIPTTENLKNSYILNLCIKNNLPCLFIGPTGTGKSVLVQKYLRALPYENYQTIFINFSAKTSANQTQEIIDGKLERRGRRTMGPPLGKKCVIFVDDLNMPALEKYGAQPPIELLRQWMDHHGWYEYKEKEKQFKELIDLIFIGAMGPPGGGRNPVSPRYIRHFNLISINNFDESVLLRIFNKLMDWHMKKQNFNSQEVMRALMGAVAGSIDVFLFAQSDLRPTPAKSHYLFNLRDLSRVIQGIQMMRKEELTDSKKVYRLWVHEIARVFSDRLINEDDQQVLYQRLFISARDKAKDDLMSALKACFDEKSFRIDGNREIMTKYIQFGDVLGEGISTYDRHVDEISPSKHSFLQEKMNGYLEDFNRVSKKPMNLVLFDFAIMHVLRVCRILRMSNGNAFLIGVGGSGRQSLSKLATFICDFQIVETEQTKNYNIEQWKDDMKRLLLMAGQDNKNCVFLQSDAQIKFGFMLEDINNLLNSGEIPNLFQPDEKLAIIEKLRPQAKKEGRINLYNNGTNEQFQDYFVEKTKAHLHIILAMSPIGNSLRERLRNFPSLVNCCTFDWFTTWPQDALEAVAEKFLQEADIENQERQAIIDICKKIHLDMIDMSKRYLSEQKRHNYVTPTSYLELILTYKELLKKQRQKTITLKLGYDKGIEKLLFTADEILKMQIDLNEKQPRLEQMTIETDALMVIIQKESNDVVEPKKIQIQEEEAIANQMAQEAQTIQIECQNDLSKALPLVKKAQEALNTIQPAHINEVKSLLKPPEPIKKVLHAVCIMCQRKVEKTPKKDNPKELEENWWYTAQKFMGEKDFLEKLLEYDKDNIPDIVIAKIRSSFLTDPDFKPQRVKQASVAAMGLCMWVRALDQYDQVAKVVAPKRARAKEAELKYKETLFGLRKKQAELRDIIEQFEKLQAQLDETAQKKQKLQDDIEDCKKKLDRAQTLLTGLGGEQMRWEEATILLGQLYKNLVGDILLASAVISYLGAFTGQYRNEAVRGWVLEVSLKRLNSSDLFSFQKILGEPVTFRQWNLSGLPSDNFSIDNGLIVFNTRRWPLMIDPQGQANKWIKNLETSSKEGSSAKFLIIKLTDPDFIRVLDQCIQLGYSVLLENIGEELDPILEPILMKQTFKSGGIISINFGDSIIEYSPEFRFYVTTKHSNPHYLPELSTKVTLINFMITFEGLKEYLLNLVVQKENAVLDEERQKLIVQSYENNKQLKEIETKILEVLRTSQGNILDDEKAIDVLKQSQMISTQIKEKQEIAQITEKKLEEARKLYMPIAQHSSLLFFIIQKLSYVDIMYQYSLSWYIQLFLMAIENAERSEFIEQRIESLKSFMTASLYQNICRSLFEKHKLLFSFILTSKLRESEGKVKSVEYDFLIANISGLDNPLGCVNPASQWLPSTIWNKLCELSRIETKFKAIVKNFENDEELWRKIYESNNPIKEQFPKSSGIESFQYQTFAKLCIIKVLRPDKLVQLIQEYVIEQMGEQFVTPPTFDLDHSFNDSTYSSPLIFVLPGADPLQSLTAFAQVKKKLDTMKSISLGQDQGPKAEKAIEEARIKGSWVLLQNCHLYPSWMPKLERICEQLDMKVGGKEVAHPSFRLWLTSYPTQDFPILILQNGIKMTNEPPKGLRANMNGSYKLEPINDLTFFDLHSKPASFKKLLYGLCMFHAIIQERRNYGSLGWNIRYEFTVSDLQISVKQLHLFTNQYDEIPFKALKYLTGECNYGGRVTDDRDRRVLKALLEPFYNEEIMNESFYAFELEDYLIPHGNLHQKKYIEQINRMPLEDPPSLFGFHPNANITKELKETSELCYDLLKMGEIEGVKVPTAKSESKRQLIRKITNQVTEIENKENLKPDVVIEKICKDILNKLPQLFDIEAVQVKYPLLRENSMNTFLVQELTRFNNLLRVISTSLKNILLALKGEALLSEQLEQVFNSLLIGDIPKMWLTVSYPSMKSVASYIKDFCLRLQTYNQWVNNGTPNVFWISGFFFTQSFLTGVFQNYARKYKVEIDTLTYDFDFLNEDPTNYNEEIYTNDKTSHQQPDDGALIGGLYFEGAQWSYEFGGLAESQPKVLFSKVPIIWLRPIRQAKQKDVPCYECPMYKTAERKGTLSTTGHSTNFILNVRTPPGSQTSTHWVKRGVAMLCQLSN